MIFQVTPRRHRGKALSQHDVQAAEPVDGDMVVVQVMSAEFKRYSDVARLSWMGPNGFVLTGFEVVDAVTYAQSWRCPPI